MNHFLSNEILLKKILSILLAISGIALPLLSFDYGVSWDERMSISYSQDLWNYFASFGDDKTCLNEALPVYNHLIYYGNIFGLCSTMLGKILPFNIVEIRHILCSLFGFLTIYFSCKISRLLGGPGLAILTLLLLVLSPRFFGHIMNGFRDTSFMLGYIATTYYLLKFWQRLPKFNFSISLKLALSIFFASSVRIGGLLGLVVLFVIIAVWLFINRTSLNRIFFSKLIMHVLFISGISFFLIVAIWPWAHSDIFIRPFKALFEFSNLQLIVNYQLFQGELIPNRNVPWDYLFVWIGITTPLVVLAGLMMVLARFKSVVMDKHSLLLVLLIATLVPIIIYFLSARNLYDSWRHFLFLAPLLGILSAFGWFSTFNKIQKSYVQKVFLTIFIVLIFLPVKSMVQFHPNQTLYFNELVGGLKGAFGRYEMDIDGNVLRQATELFNDYSKNLKNKTIVLGTNNDPLSVTHFLENKETAANIKWIPEDQLYTLNWDYALVSSRRMSKYKLNHWPFKESVLNYKIDGVPVVSILKRQNWSGLKGFESLEKGQNEMAIKLFNQAITFDPTVECYYRYTGVAYLNSNKLPRAEHFLKEASKLDPSNTFPQYYLALLSFYKADYAEALKLLDRSKKNSLNNYQVDCLRAKIFYGQNDFERSKELLDELLKDESINTRDLSIISNTYGELYLYEFQRSESKCESCFHSAIEMFQEAVNYDKRNPQPYLNSIEIYKSIGSENDVLMVKQLMSKYID